MTSTLPSRCQSAEASRSVTATKSHGCSFIDEGEPMHELHGTIVLLRDCGFEGNDLVEWLTTEEESLGVAPVDALKAGRKAEVRRIAQALL